MLHWLPGHIRTSSCQVRCPAPSPAVPHSASLIVLQSGRGKRPLVSDQNPSSRPACLLCTGHTSLDLDSREEPSTVPTIHYKLCWLVFTATPVFSIQATMPSPDGGHPVLRAEVSGTLQAPPSSMLFTLSWDGEIPGTSGCPAMKGSGTGSSHCCLSTCPHTRPSPGLLWLVAPTSAGAIALVVTLNLSLRWALH